MTARPFRFGVVCRDAGSGRHFAELARRAEDLGYSTFFIPDHFVGHPLAPVPAMSAAAAVTARLRVGSLVLGNDYKHPVVLARELATVDLLSEGRLEIGLGAGWMTEDYERAGLTMDTPGTRIRRLEESVEVLRGLFADGPFTYVGEHFKVSALDGRPSPVQQPCPPLLIGGGGKRMLTYAARTADIVGINANLRNGTTTDASALASISAAATDEKVQWVRDAAGERYRDLELQSLCGLVSITDDPRSVAEQFAPALGLDSEGILHASVVLIGTVSSAIEELEARRRRWDISYVVIPIEFMNEFAPVVEHLSGR